MSFSTHSRAELRVALLMALVVVWLPPSPSVAHTREPTADTLAAKAGPHPLLPGSRLSGEATLRYWGLRIYNARLWTLPSVRAEQVADHPLVLELEYLRDLKGRAIAERSLTEMQRAGPIPEQQAQQWLAHMQRIFPDVKNGDRLTGQHHPGVGASFVYNGQPIGRVEDAEFARRFFGIWLAATTSQPDMRTSLLGLSPANER
jgi:hypothetical protein